MAELLPYKKLPNYPHMKPADIAIWERFIAENPVAYDLVQYDLNCGEGASPLDHEDPAIRKSFGMLTARKIDVVGFKGDAVDIIEIKPHAGPSAIGQVRGYLHLYLGYVNPHAKARPVLITDSVENDMPFLSAKEQVRLIVV